MERMSGAPTNLSAGKEAKIFWSARLLENIQGKSCCIMECDFGEFEMKNYDELSGDALYQEWIRSGGRAPFLNDESMGRIKARALKGFYRVMEMTGGADACFIVHGGITMANVLQIAGGDFYSYQVKNGACIVCETALRKHK